MEDVPGKLEKDDTLLNRLAEAAAYRPWAEVPAEPVRLLRELGRDLQPPLRQPVAVALDAAGRGAFVLDRPEAECFRLTRCLLSGEMEALAAFARGSADDELLDPVGLALDGSQCVYVADARANCVKKFRENGHWVETYRSAGARGEQLDGPRAAVTDAAGCLYVADTNNHRVVKLRPDGEFVWSLDRFVSSDSPSEVEELYEPCSVAVSSQGGVCVADTNNNRVLLLDAEGNPRGQLGGDFHFPARVCWGPEGRILYVADRNNTRVQRFDPTGVLTGSRVLTHTDGALLGNGDVEVDAAGRVWRIDPLRETLLVFAFEET